jgi:hypothetical protein
MAHMGEWHMTFYQIDTLFSIINVRIFMGYGCPINFNSYSYVDPECIQFLVTLFNTFCKKCRVKLKSKGFSKCKDLFCFFSM